MSIIGIQIKTIRGWSHLACKMRKDNNNCAPVNNPKNTIGLLFCLNTLNKANRVTATTINVNKLYTSVEFSSLNPSNWKNRLLKYKLLLSKKRPIKPATSSFPAALSYGSFNNKILLCPANWFWEPQINLTIISYGILNIN